MSYDADEPHRNEVEQHRNNDESFQWWYRALMLMLVSFAIAGVKMILSNQVDQSIKQQEVASQIIAARADISDIRVQLADIPKMKETIATMRAQMDDNRAQMHDNRAAIEVLQGHRSARQ